MLIACEPGGSILSRSEFLELPGHENRNRSHCDSELSTTIVFFEALNDAERLGIEAGELEGEVTEILRAFPGAIAA